MTQISTNQNFNHASFSAKTIIWVCANVSVMVLGSIYLAAKAIEFRRQANQDKLDQWMSHSGSDEYMKVLEAFENPSE